MPDQYYTPCNVGIYIGGYKISDAFRVDWDARDSKTPLYGWADETYSAVTKGRKIVTGRIVINYRYPGYLTAAIAEFRKQHHPINDSQESIDNHNYNELRGKSTSERVRFLAQMVNKNYGDDRLAKNVDNYSDLFLLTGPKLPREYRDKGNVYGPAYKSKDKFDILVTYGDIMTEKHIELKLVDAYIVGQSQAISASATGGGDVSSSGSPIYEIYSFFAKEIVEIMARPRNNMGTTPANTDTF